MPIISIEYDATKVSDDDILKLSQIIQRIVSDITQIEDVSVYANSPKIQVKIAPIEVFIQMSEHKINDTNTLTSDIKNKVSAWKKEINFKPPINLTLIPMQWKIEIGI